MKGSARRGTQGFQDRKRGADFMNGRHVHSRRSLLKAMGLGPALLPLLEAERALGACGGVSGPRRVFILVWANGMCGGPTEPWATTGPNFTLAPQMAPLAPYTQDLILMDGLDYDFITDMPGSGERTGKDCFPGMLTGAFYQLLSTSSSSDLAGGISIDQYIGNGLRTKGYLGLRSLNLAVQAVSTGRLSWKAAGVPIIPNGDPVRAFSTVFVGQSAMPPVDQILAMRKSVLDYVIGDLNRFVGTVGGTQDKANVASHLQNVRDLEQRLAQLGVSTAAPACVPPVLAPVVTSGPGTDFEVVTKMQIDLAVAALAADATRVVVLQLGDQTNANVLLPSLGSGFEPGLGPLKSDPNTGDVNGLHAIAHEDGARKVIVDTWFMSQLAYAISSLQGVLDGAGTMLDNTALLAMSNMRTGQEESTGVPAILAGSCGGYFKTGRSLNLTNTPNNGVLIALANAMGVPTTTFGEAMYGGELTVLKG
jgi:hypothetical protein